MKYGEYKGNEIEALLNIIGGKPTIDGLLAGTMEFVVKTKDTAEKAVSFITATYKQTIDYNKSIKDLLKAGKFDWTNDDIKDENFPSAESGKKEIEFGVFHLDKTVSSEDTIAEMKKVGYRPATMRELLSFGAKNPGLQRKYPIVALGSVTELGSFQHVGCLNGSDSKRSASLNYFGNDWGGSCRFLAVRN